MSRNSLKTNSGLVAYAKTKLNHGYWYGCFCQTADAQLFREKSRQYPQQYPPQKWTKESYTKDYGTRVCDCVGLIKGYLWSDTPTSNPKYNASQDYSADGMYRIAAVKGPIKTFDKVVGRLVFKGTDAKKTHVGVYIGGDKVIEAKGHAYGVVQSNINDGWTHWAQCKFITCDVKPQGEHYPGAWPVLPKKGFIAKGNKGQYVGKMQAFLEWYKPGCLAPYGVDNSCGSVTDKAIRMFQQAEGLVVDGKFGPKSLAKAKEVTK